MRIYRSVWLASCTAFVMLGLLVGLAVSPAAVGAASFWATIVGATVAFAVSFDGDIELGSGRGEFVLRGAALGVSVVAGAPGLVVALGAHFFVVVLLLTVSSPPMLGRCLRWLHSAPWPSAEQFGAAMTAAAWASPGCAPMVSDAPSESARLAGALQRLSDEELCQRWQRSCGELAAQSSVIARIGAVEERRGLLEELERRNPAGYVAWIISEAPRSATLLGHLSDMSGAPPRIDWDAMLP
jgi:hypothetical protein